ncbi:FAD-binding oxidoreductase [Mycolicibacterium helvum]|uniref:Phenol hydroxylase P5 protein n=1 Tax=Mycolicibacterium helvum TaxID=1534349 RepID=A0A7I7T422_9MYCO|nr:FAD-binding oxidoreductase [Mycolicibacterium helvum]BBY63633.1 phenol hydroxylase P5 protein [Mycolicibacterium helvum]
MSDSPSSTAHTLTVEPFGIEVTVDAGERVLHAVLRSGHYVPFGCNHGGCGTCTATVVSGDLQQDPGTLQTLDEDARRRGEVLLCSTTLLSSAAVVDISASGVTEEEFSGTAVHDLSTTVEEISALSDNLRILRLAAPAHPWQHRPGQFLQVELPDQTGWRAYSVASSPADPTLDLLIRSVPGGAFTAALDTLRSGDRIRIRGPFGAFNVRTSHRPKLFIGAGAGIGPLRPMLAQHLAAPEPPAAELIHIASDPAEFAFATEFRDWAQRHSGFTYHPLPPDDCRRGTEVVSEWISSKACVADLRRVEAYLCGPDAFVDTVAESLRASGLRSRYISADRFTASVGTTR